MTHLNKLIVLAAMASLPLAGYAQFDTGAGRAPSQSNQSNPWADFKLDSKKTVQLNFRNANVDLVLDFFMKATGITIVKDPTLKEPLTVSSPKAVSLSQAFEILNAALGLRSYDFEKQGSLLIIKKRQERGNNNNNNDRGGFGGMTPEQIAGMFGGGNSQSELKYYKIQYAAASQVAQTINDVFVSQNNPFANFRGGGGGGRGGRGGGGFQFPSPQQPTIRASADDYSNTLIVNAPRDKQRDIEDLIAEIDKATEQPVKTEVYPLEFADATQLTSTLQTVLSGQPQTGRGANLQAQGGGGGGRGGRGGGGFFNFLLGGSSQNTNVAADTRSNAVIVTTTTENQEIVAKLIEELDKDLPIENTTFVIPLSNARAEAVSQIMNQAFGGGRTGTNNRNTGNNNRQNNNNRNTGNRNNQGGQGGRAAEDTSALELDLVENGNANDESELFTQVRVGQNFGGGRTNAQQQGGLVRGQDGRLTNVRSLDGVTIIPDPNTNSLIVVTDPENLELIQQILNQLDKVPEQVMIETMIVEATLDKSLKFGVEWNYVQERAFGSAGVTGSATQDLGQQTNPLPQGFRYSLSGGNLTAFVNALQTDDKFQVLSTPRIFTSNNVEAEINISQSIPYVLSTREDNNGNLTFNYAFQDVGIVLNVIPQISANGYVTLDVVQTANDLQGFTDFNAPIVNQRQAQTTVSVKDGETIILGGIMRNTVTSRVKKLPLLGDIPILGELFKSTSRQNTKTELLVFLTPRVVKNEEDARKLREDEEGRMSEPSQKALKEASKRGEATKQTGGIKSGPKQSGGK